MKKFTALFLLVVMSAVLLSGCSSTKLSDSFDKDTVEKSAKQVIEDLNNDDYDSVISMFRDDLKEELTAGSLKDAATKTYGNAGKFEKYKSVSILGQKVKSTKEDCAVAIVVANYEKQKVEFTLSFDTDMKLIGLYMK
ncbi:Protein of unknown function [Anaerocolumna jejuensis DSM 15929]|uniref:DUF3887 domain-containing protein n=1 Tax=Anaerocolumna jejuensis DSM 15929 TaxID=1121322 RepID=A0A1M6U4Z4_9FIRM|nr:DUF3887 domain-containing protein [Anaerocolumna jejuensis]SHK64322.1 Protein of unknown function [Anaerocolumna jejuensis DSM 15929]